MIGVFQVWLSTYICLIRMTNSQEEMMISKYFMTAALLCCVAGVSPAFSNFLFEDQEVPAHAFNHNAVDGIVQNEAEADADCALWALATWSAFSVVDSASQTNNIFQGFISMLQNPVLVNYWQGTDVLTTENALNACLKRNAWVPGYVLPDLSPHFLISEERQNIIISSLLYLYKDN